MLIVPAAADASTYRWRNDADGGWNSSLNWEVVDGPAGVGFPNLAGDVAMIDRPFTAARTITIMAFPIRIGRLIVRSPTVGTPLTIDTFSTGSLTFDNLGEEVIIDTSGANSDTLLSTPIAIDDHLIVNGAVHFSGIDDFTRGRNVTITGGNVRFIERNVYRGTTTVLAGSLSMTDIDAIRIPGDLIVGDGSGASGSARVSLSGKSIAPTALVTVLANGSFDVSKRVMGSGDLSIGALTIVDGHVSASRAGTELTMTSLTMEGGQLSPRSGTQFRVTGGVTVTSTAAGPARVEDPGLVVGSLSVAANPADLTVADGPQPIDFVISVPFGPAAGAPVRKLGSGVARLTGSNAFANYSEPTSILAGTLLVDITMPNTAVSVAPGATLGGTGHVGSITAPDSRVLVGGATRTGLHGILETGPVAFNGSALFFDISGGAAGNGFDQLSVTGTVTLANSALSLTSSLVIPPAATFAIINNDGADPVVGIFAGRPEGATINTANGGIFTISYQGGDGNDVVLTNLTPVTYFLSEGATGTFFDEDVLIANPNGVPAPVTMTFFLPGGSAVVQQRTVPAQSRLTVRVNDIPGVESTSPSVEVKSDDRLTLAVDRTMFWDKSHYGGHTANAARLDTQWLFAEGAQNAFFQTYLLLVNPNPVLVQATVTFLRDSESPVTKTIDLPASSRVTVYAGDHAELVGRSFGISVSAPLAIAAERSMYFASTPGRHWTGGHVNVGSPAPSTSWFHPEGASGTFFSTFILVSNPQNVDAVVSFKFLLPSGETIEEVRTIPAMRRLTLNPVDSGDLRLASTAFSTVVTSSIPVVSERAMYWPGDDTAFGEGHASSGLTTTALDWVLAEGRVGGPSAYTTYILLANPQNGAANVRVTFLPETGPAIVKTLTVNATSRFNIDVGDMVPELRDTSFGARIEVLNNRAIAVERSMYWNADGRFWAGGSNALASIVPQ